MPRPATKKDLITAANERFNEMWALIDGMTEAERSMPCLRSSKVFPTRSYLRNSILNGAAQLISRVTVLAQQAVIMTGRSKK